jgi:iron complex outermembrane receptor protein
MAQLSKLYISTILSVGILAIAATPAMANGDLEAKELLNLSLEQLSNIEVTSVSKKSEKASEAAAAIYVITQDDIQRSGMTSIPELLRMVPGLNVAQSNSHGWAISARGSSDQFANKLLVLMDGRTVYSPLFSGVFWDVQDTPLRDIERIEVIRGPGATLWGANAVNGVINIITKNAADTTGGYVSQTVGNLDKSLTDVRYGAKIGENAHARIYAKHSDRDEFRTLTETGTRDEWNKSQAGFRSDWKSGDTETFTLQGDVYRASENYLSRLPIQTNTYTVAPDRETNSGANILGRWNHQYSETSNVTLQMFYDNAKRDNMIFQSDIDTFDIDAQHVWTELQGQEIVWGGAYRLVRTDTKGNSWLLWTPQDQKKSTFSAFVQDKITLNPKDVFLTLGSKFERNDFTGFEYQPSARISWLPDDKQTVWASISRAVHIPDITADSLQLIAQPVGVSTFAGRIGSPSSGSEELVAYELGYRVQPAENISLDVSTFYNDYTELTLGASGPTVFGSSPVLGSYALVTAVPVNVGTATSYGLELSAKWNPTSYAELAAGYTYLNLKFDQADPFGLSFANKAPKQQFNVRSSFQLPYNLEFNTALYYVGPLGAKSLSSGLSVDSYYRLDSRLAWKPIDGIEVSLVGQNLLDPAHPEFAGFLYQSDSQVPRSVYANVTWKF